MNILFITLRADFGIGANVVLTGLVPQSEGLNI